MQIIFLFFMENKEKSRKMKRPGKVSRMDVKFTKRYKTKIIEDWKFF